MAATPFADDPQLQYRVNQGLSDPSLYPLLSDVTSYVQRLQSQIASLHSQIETARQSVPPGFATANAAPANHAPQPPAKKRKLPGDDDDSNGAPGGSASYWKTGPPALTARDVSFSVPMRKKLCLELVSSTSTGEGGLRAVVQGSREIEGGLRWSDIDQVMVVPVPEKAQPTTNFVVIPKAEVSPDALVWTVPGTGAPKNWLLDGARPVEAGYQDALQVVLDKALAPHGRRVVAPSADEFVSNVVQAHRKGEKNWHVKGWLGSKEGYLYPLPTGLLFGFKKPVLFFPFRAITSISYTSVLQRTFNLVVAAAPHPAIGGPDTHYEFSMLDQADFAPLDAFVRKHGLHDASLAAGRRAQSTARPGARGGADANAGAGEEGENGESELARAERELQDAEDEEEEDFDPGSGGESDGSGEDSEDEDGGAGGGDGEDLGHEYDDDDDDE